MIVLTVGMQLPFDRLVQAMDELAADLGETIVGQIGQSRYAPRWFKASESIPVVEFERLVAESRLIVAHAGIGTVLTAQRLRKPLVIFPRRAAYGEHRNDHQLATCAQLADRKGIYVVHAKQDLARLLKAPLDAPDAGVGGSHNHFAANLRQALAAL